MGDTINPAAVDSKRSPCDESGRQQQKSTNFALDRAPMGPRRSMMKKQVFYLGGSHD